MNFDDNTFIRAEGIFYPGILNAVKKHRNPLQPLFEAFTNALESIQSFLDKKDLGLIIIKFFFHENLFKEREFYKIVVEDNGVGFNDTEFARFVTYQDDRKGYSNKGSGRLQLIHYFGNCEYQSTFYTGEAGYHERKFKISKAPSFLQENAITFLESTKPVEANSTLTTLSLSNLLSDKDKEYYNHSTQQLKEILITHYMHYFCSHRDTLPKIIIQAYVNNVLQPSETVEILSSDIPPVDSQKEFVVNYHQLSTDGREIVELSNGENFLIKAYRINKNKLDKNSIKLTSKDEIIESNDFKIELNSLSADDTIENNRFLFLISSPFINNSDSDRRGELRIAKRENFKKENSLFNKEEIFLEDIRDRANDNIMLMYDEIKQKNEEKWLQIEELKEMFLLNDEILKDISISLNDSEEKILEKVYTAESKFVAKGDSEIKRQMTELNSLNPASVDYENRFDAAIKKLVKEIPLQNRTVLTHYVARRKLVLELFGRILDKKLAVQETSQRNITEKLLHNLIFKQHSKNPDTSDLWLVNEDFILFEGTSESKLRDIKIGGIKLLKESLTEEEEKYINSLEENRYDKRPDVLLFPDEGKCIIIEFKAIDVNLGEHLNQINRYASLILNLSKDEFKFTTFYGYLIGEAMDPNDIRDFDGDFKNAPHFNYVFRPSKAIAGRFGRPDGALYTEIIKYSTLKDRAQRRNEVFLDKLRNKNMDDTDDFPW